MNKPHNSGFTLIEMLVVIAIIALLISLITPTVSRTIERARTTGCLSNMRQIAAALIDYTVENEGALPRFQRRQHEPDGPSIWVGELILAGFLDAPLVDDPHDIPSRTILFCPSGYRDEIWNGHLPGGPFTEGRGIHRPWAAAQKVESGEIKFVHFWYGTNARTAARANTGWPFIRDGTNPNLRSSMIRLIHADRTVMFYDGAWSHNSGDNRIYARHGNPRNTTNFAFFDGRVENLRARPFDVSSSSEDTYPIFRGHSRSHR